jgi:hypothetical protein
MAAACTVRTVFESTWRACACGSAIARTSARGAAKSTSALRRAAPSLFPLMHERREGLSLGFPPQSIVAVDALSGQPGVVIARPYGISIGPSSDPSFAGPGPPIDSAVALVQANMLKKWGVVFP